MLFGIRGRKTRLYEVAALMLMTITGCRSSEVTNANPNSNSEKINKEELEKKLFAPPDNESLQELLDEWLKVQPEGEVLAHIPGKGALYESSSSYFPEASKAFVDLFNKNREIVVVDEDYDNFIREDRVNRMFVREDTRPRISGRFYRGLALFVKDNPEAFGVLSEAAEAYIRTDRLDDDLREWWRNRRKEGFNGKGMRSIVEMPNIKSNILNKPSDLVNFYGKWDIELDTSDIRLVNNLKELDKRYGGDFWFKFGIKTGAPSLKMSTITNPSRLYEFDNPGVAAEFGIRF